MYRGINIIHLTSIHICYILLYLVAIPATYRTDMAMATQRTATTQTQTTSERLAGVEVRLAWYMDAIPTSGTKGNTPPAGGYQS